MMVWLPLWVVGLFVWLILMALLYHALFSGVGMGVVPWTRWDRAEDILLRVGIVVAFPILVLWLLYALVMERRKSEVLECSRFRSDSPLP